MTCPSPSSASVPSGQPPLKENRAAMYTYLECRGNCPLELDSAAALERSPLKPSHPREGDPRGLVLSNFTSLHPPRPAPTTLWRQPFPALDIRHSRTLLSETGRLCWSLWSSSCQSEIYSHCVILLLLWG